MQARTIEFLGQAVTIPYIGGRRLVRIGEALRAFSGAMTIDVGSGPQTLAQALNGLPVREYPRIVLLAAQTVLDQSTGTAELSVPERLFYGTIGELLGFSAEQVADAPLDELTAACLAIYEQERDTQAGKWLIRTFATYGAAITASAPAEPASDSSSDTTMPAGTVPTPATTGAA